MSGVFLSYRRADARSTVDRIYDRLVGRFGDDRVYRDVDDIPLGVDFVTHITNALTTAAYVLVAIGPRWMTLTTDEGARRLDDPQDPVRFEVRTALELDRLVVPMLVDGTEMPAKGDLPRDIRKLVARNGIAVRPEPYFEDDVDDLMSGLSLDGVDRQRLPRPFDVGIVARHLGFGGAIGWGAIGLILGVLAIAFSDEPRPTPFLVLGSLLAGIVAGFVGGAIVGWVTGRLVRDHSPPLVARRVRRMGITWAFGVVAAILIAGAISGLVIWFMIANDDSEGWPSLGAGIAAFLVGIFVFLVAMVFGSALLAGYFARRFRLRADDLSRARALVIGLVWFLGSFVTLWVLFGLIAAADAVLGTG